jgi:hypothetical protein
MELILSLITYGALNWEHTSWYSFVTADTTQSAQGALSWLGTKYKACQQHLKKNGRAGRRGCKYIFANQGNEHHKHKEKATEHPVGVLLEGCPKLVK